MKFIFALTNHLHKMHKCIHALVDTGPSVIEHKYYDEKRRHGIPKNKLTYSLNHSHTVVETPYQLTLRLGSWLHKQLRGCHKLSGLGGQEVARPQELVLILLSLFTAVNTNVLGFLTKKESINNFTLKSVVMFQQHRIVFASLPNFISLCVFFIF